MACSIPPNLNASTLFLKNKSAENKTKENYKQNRTKKNEANNKTKKNRKFKRICF
jgi:hypothetical protein